MKKTFAILIFASFFVLVASAQFTGQWHGVISVGAQQLPLVFNIAHDGATYSATMDSPMQGAKGIPAEISVSADTVKIDIPVIDAQYRGVYGGGAISGVFKQRGMGFNLNLEPGDYIPPRPQTPQPPFFYPTREVSFTADDGYQLQGTLTLPLQYNMPGNNKFSAVVMVTGSGTQNRDEEIFGHKPFAVIAHHLALNGIASLRYDDRGYADTIADMSKVTTATNVSDAKAALRYMRENVDRLGLIGVLGHSEGGTIAFILGAENDANFVVSLAGSSIRGDSILLTQNDRLLRPQLGDALTDAYIEALKRAYDFMRNNPGADVWPGMDEALADLNLPSPLTDNIKAIINQRNAWIDYFIQYDPAEAIKNLEVPVFAANGTLDMQVDCGQNLGALRALLPYGIANVIKEYPGLNHLMQNATAGMPAEYGEIEETISTDLLHDISDWIKNL